MALRTLIRPEREAGGYLWHRAWRQIFVVLITLFACIWLLGFATGRGGVTAFVIEAGVILVFLTVSWFTARRRPLDPDSWLSGLAGEVTVARLLGMLPEGFEAVHDIALRGAGGKSFNIDHVVVGPTGIFVLETKNWSGTFAVVNGEARHNGYSMAPVIGRTTNAAMRVREAVVAAGVTPPWIQAVIVSTKAPVLAPRARLDVGHVTVIAACDLVPYVREKRGAGLAIGDVATVVEALGQM